MDQPFRDYLEGKAEMTLDLAMRVHSIASREMLKFLAKIISAAQGV